MKSLSMEKRQPEEADQCVSSGCRMERMLQTSSFCFKNEEATNQHKKNRPVMIKELNIASQSEHI